MKSPLSLGFPMVFPWFPMEIHLDPPRSHRGVAHMFPWRFPEILCRGGLAGGRGRLRLQGAALGRAAAGAGA